MDPRNSLEGMAVVTSSFLVDDILNRRHENSDVYENRMSEVPDQNFLSPSRLDLCATAPLYSFGDRRTPKDFDRSCIDNDDRYRLPNSCARRSNSLNFDHMKDNLMPDPRNQYEGLSCMVAEAERKAEENARHAVNPPNEAGKKFILFFMLSYSIISISDSIFFVYFFTIFLYISRKQLSTNEPDMFSYES